jgi:hypothetical protein
MNNFLQKVFRLFIVIFIFILWTSLFSVQPFNHCPSTFHTKDIFCLCIENCKPAIEFCTRFVFSKQMKLSLWAVFSMLYWWGLHNISMVDGEWIWAYAWWVLSFGTHEKEEHKEHIAHYVHVIYMVPLCYKIYDYV